MASLIENLGAVNFDNLFAENAPESDVVTVKLAASQGVLKRGSVISGEPGGNMSLVSAALAPTVAVAGSSGTISKLTAYILADDVDTGTSGVVTAVAYRTGHFNRNALIVGSSYTLTDADEEFLRGLGILLSDALDV